MGLGLSRMDWPKCLNSTLASDPFNPGQCSHARITHRILTVAGTFNSPIPPHTDHTEKGPLKR